MFIIATLSERRGWVVVGVLSLALVSVFGFLMASLWVWTGRKSLLFLVVSHPLPSTFALTTCPAPCWAFLLLAISWNLFCSYSDRLYQHTEHCLLNSLIS